MNLATGPFTDHISLFSLQWDKVNWNLDFTANAWLIAAVVAALCLAMIWRWWIGGWSFHSFEIDQAEIGVGQSKFRFKPNLTDRQVAYAIWVELSTRKIGLQIDLEHDVIYEIYDSWYNFFCSDARANQRDSGQSS